MRVLQILISPDPGGVSALAAIIGDGLEKNGMQVETRYMVERPDMGFAERLIGALKATWRIATGRHDIVVAYQPSTSILVGVAGFLFGKRRRIVHQTTVPSANRKIIRKLDYLVGSLGLYPRNVVNTAYTRSLYKQYPKAYRRSLLLIEHGISVPVTRGAGRNTLAKYGIPQDAFLILNTGRLSDQKNQKTLLHALRELPEARVVIAGEGELRRDLEALAGELGVADRLHLLGAIPRQDCLELYGACDVFAFPSHHETFGISAVEAVMLGMPTIVADIEVLREVLSIEGDSVARFVAPDDVAGWREAIDSVRRTGSADEERRRDFAAALEEKYSEQRMIARYMTLFTEI